MIELCNDLPGLGKERMTALCEVFVRDHLPDCDPYDPAQGSVRGLVTRMRTACNMLLQGLSGIRVSELCGIPAGVWNEEIGLPGAIEIERTFDDEYELFYLVAEVFKDSGSSEPGKWILGMRPTGSDYLPLPVKAAQILHRLDAGWRASSGVDRLVVNFTGSVAFPSVEKAVSPTLGNTLRYWQRRWLTETGHLGEDDRLTTHMWRKTWARYMVRVSGGLLPAISHHFKHLSVAFTEVAYCQPRAAARQIISDARVAEAGETILGVITGETPVEGPVARELRDLAVEMRGRFANRPAYERRNDVSEALRIRNIQVYRADFGICVFRGDGARCHLLADDPRLPLLRMAPAFARQTPDVCAGCRNFGIDRRHRQFWVERLEKARHRAASYGSGRAARSAKRGRAHDLEVRDRAGMDGGAAMTRREDAAYTPQERAFLDAIERILAGKPKNPDLQPCAVGRKRQKLKLTVANMALEAGYARTYVYKNADAMARVMRRFEEVTKPRQPASTTADLLTRLRQDNARLKRERDLAIDVTRRWMQEADARNERNRGARTHGRAPHQGERGAPCRRRLRRCEAQRCPVRPCPGSELGRRNAAALARYLEETPKGDVPISDGRPNASRIAAACGFDRAGPLQEPRSARSSTRSCSRTTGSTFRRGRRPAGRPTGVREKLQKDLSRAHAQIASLTAENRSLKDRLRRVGHIEGRLLDTGRLAR